MKERQKDLVPIGDWVHSFEEDEADKRVYRRSGTHLPMSRRPRERLVFREGGGLDRVIGGPTDAGIAKPGRWEMAGGNQVHLFLHADAAPVVWSIDHVDAELMVLRQPVSPT